MLIEYIYLFYIQSITNYIHTKCIAVTHMTDNYFNDMMTLIDTHYEYI
jgi:hypothetical protein